MPPLFIIPFSKDPIDNLLMFLPPAIVMGMALSGTIMRLTRTMMLETLRQDYIRTAWSKGLKERVIVLRHALKNALIPVVTLIGLRVGLLMGGAVVIEKIFNLPGLGRLLFDAVSLRDYSIVSALMLIFAAVFILAKSHGGPNLRVFGPQNSLPLKGKIKEWVRQVVRGSNILG